MKGLENFKQGVKKVRDVGMATFVALNPTSSVHAENSKGTVVKNPQTQGIAKNKLDSLKTKPMEIVLPREESISQIQGDIKRELDTLQSFAHGYEISEAEYDTLPGIKNRITINVKHVDDQGRKYCAVSERAPLSSASQMEILYKLDPDLGVLTYYQNQIPQRRLEIPTDSLGNSIIEQTEVEKILNPYELTGKAIRRPDNSGYYRIGLSGGPLTLYKDGTHHRSRRKKRRIRKNGNSPIWSFFSHSVGF
jgi:hypothetical protein